MRRPASVLRHAQPARREVDVAPSKVDRFADPQPGERQRREQHTTDARVRRPRSRFAVELAGGVEQWRDLVGLKPYPPRLDGLQSAALAARGVALDDPVLDGLLEHLA